MASKEEFTELAKSQTWVLKVSIHCEGCKKKVKKILQNIHGVHSVDIDSQQNKVTVTGAVDAETLIRRLAKSGKHADIWPEMKPANPNHDSGSNPKEKNKEKESKESETTAEKKTNQPAADEVAAVDKTSADTKPAEKPKELAAAAAAEPEAPKPVKKPEKGPADTNSDTGTKQADTSTNKKGKKQGEPSAAAEGQSGNFSHHQPMPAYQVPVYQQPIYAVSHDTVQPTASHSYYYTPQPVPQTYSGYNYSHPPQPLPEYYPPGNYGHYGSDNYYTSAMESRSVPSHSYSYYGSSQLDPYYYGSGPDSSYSTSRSSQGGLDMFSDENPNGCNVM